MSQIFPGHASFGIFDPELVKVVAGGENDSNPPGADKISPKSGGDHCFELD